MTCHPMEQHYLLLAGATAGWKGCIAYLADEVQGQVQSRYMEVASTANTQ